jgi:hypothetical protein
MRRSRPGKCLVRSEHKLDCAERGDQRPVHSIRHGTHQLVGYWAAFQRNARPGFWCPQTHN